jgi:peptide deformylase
MVKKHKLEATGLLAICLQHEIDHLNGKLIIDYFSKIKQNIMFKKALKRKLEIESNIEEDNI